MADKIKFELDEFERDLLLKFSGHLDYLDLDKRIANARRKGDFYTVKFSQFELEQMAGELSAIINHDQADDVFDELNELVDRFESRLKGHNWQ